MKIRRLLTIVLISFAIIPMTSAVAIVLAGLDNYADESFYNQTSQIFNSKASGIEGYFNINESKVRTIAALEDVIDVAAMQHKLSASASHVIYNDEHDDLYNMLLKICNTDLALAGIHLVGIDDIVIVSTNRDKIGEAYMWNSHEKESARNGAFISSSSTIIPFYSEVLDLHGEIVAFVVLDVKVAHISFIMRENMPSDFDNIILIDPNDHILSQVSDYTIYIEDSLEPKKILEELNKKDEININAGEFLSYKYLDKDRLAYIKEAGNTGWKLVAYTRTRTVKSNLISVKTTVFLFYAVIISVSVGVAIIFPYRILKPMHNIVNTIHSIKRGNFDARVKETSNNEYGDMARAFNALADQIVVSEGRYRTIVEMSDNIIFEWQFREDEVFVASTFNKKFSFRSASDKYGDSFLANMDLYYEDRKRFREDVQTIKEAPGLFQGEYRFKSIYGDYMWVLLRVKTEVDQDGKPCKAVGVIIDIDRAKKRERDLHRMASFDALTGLYNRATFEKTLNNEIELSMKRKAEDAIMFIDIDDFKIFNDKYGHAVGDEVLKFTAKAIREVVDPYGFVGRYAGDEFVVCIKNTQDDMPDKIAQTLLNKLREGFHCEIIDDTISVNCSIGIAIVEGGKKNYEEIIADADEAMYKIKKSGKSRYGYL